MMGEGTKESGVEFVSLALWKALVLGENVNFSMDLPYIKLIFLCTLSVTATRYSAPFPLLLPCVLYVRNVLSV